MPRFLLVLLALLLLVPAAPADAAGKQQRKADARATKLVADGKYVGYRASGEYVEDIFCRNRRYSGRVDDGISSGRFKITEAVFTKKGFTAVVSDPEGYSVAIGRRKGQWQIGLTRGGTPDVTSFHDVKRTNATAECAELKAAAG